MFINLNATLVFLLKNMTRSVRFKRDSMDLRFVPNLPKGRGFHLHLHEIFLRSPTCVNCCQEESQHSKWLIHASVNGSFLLFSPNAVVVHLRLGSRCSID